MYIRNDLRWQKEVTGFVLIRLWDRNYSNSTILVLNHEQEKSDNKSGYTVTYLNMCLGQWKVKFCTTRLIFYLREI